MDGHVILPVVDGFNTMPTLQHRTKGSVTKIIQNCPTVIKMCNTHTGGVDLLDQQFTACCVDCKSKLRFYFRIFFDLMDIACANVFIVFNVFYPEKKLKTLHCKIVVAKFCIGIYRNWVRSVKKVEQMKRIETIAPLGEELHLPEILATCSWWEYCKTNGIENQSCIHCSTCNAYLCFVKDRNSFLLDHMSWGKFKW